MASRNSLQKMMRLACSEAASEILETHLMRGSQSRSVCSCHARRAGEGSTRQYSRRARRSGPPPPHPTEDVGRQRALMGARFDDLQPFESRLGRAAARPYLIGPGRDDLLVVRVSSKGFRSQPLRELKSQKFAQQRADADAGEKIAAPPYFALPFVIAQAWRVERQFHETRKGNRPVAPDFLLNLQRQAIHFK